MAKNVIPAKNLQPGMKITYRNKVRTVRYVAPELVECLDGRFRVVVSMEDGVRVDFMPNRKCELL